MFSYVLNYFSHGSIIQGKTIVVKLLIFPDNSDLIQKNLNPKVFSELNRYFKNPKKRRIAKIIPTEI